jgi:hypothetical protein
MIKEEIDQLEFKYLFIKKWVWNDTMVKEDMNGHPITNRVYRAVYNKQTQNTKLLIEPDIALVFEQADQVDKDLVELTSTNLIHQNVSEEDLDHLIYWLTNKDSEMQAYLGKNEQPFNPLQIISMAMQQHDQEEVEAANRALNAMRNLWLVNNIQFETVVALAEALTEYSVEREEDKTSFLLLGKNGSMVNIREALLALQRYSSDDRRTNGDEADVFEAVIALITELERKVLNDE